MSERFRLGGLRGGVDILEDGWGIPHIYAGCSHDALHAQGFAIARARLWQLDLWLRAGLGRLAEVLGPDWIERDRAARLFLYRGSMETERAAYGCDLDEVLTPFVAGINAWIRLTRERPELLAPEFELLDYEPAQWSTNDVLRIRIHGRYRNLRSEVARAQLLHAFGAEAEALRVRLDPRVELTVPEGLDLSAIPSDVLRVYDLATGPAFPLGAPAPLTAADGSNNWVLGGARTASGRPILANDPHRALLLPSLRTLVHVSCPDFAFAGGGEPMLPGISFGHNGRMAFGLTVLPIDQEDLYVYELDDVGGARYRYESGWQQIEVTHEQIEVRDSEPVDVELRFTRHGPIVYESAERNAACAVRAAWLEPGMVPYLGSAALLATHGWEAFRDAARHWGAPGENLVYADVDGDIGWQPAGRIPLRPNWSGLLPVPGDGRYEWDGWAAPALLPHEHNPDRGWIATANQCNVELAATGGATVAYEWEPPFRQRRIADVLASARAHTIEDSIALQSDYLSLAAVDVLPLLRGLLSDDPRVQRGVAMLVEWDGQITADSASAAIFESWFRIHLRRALFADALVGRLPVDAVDGAVEAILADESVVRDARIDLELLDAARADEARLSALLERTLSETMLELERQLGPDPATWRWGALHQASFEHPLADRHPTVRSLGPVPRGGSCDTVGNTTYGPGNFRQTFGATARLVVDVGEWDRSRAMNAPGQGGDPEGPHYDDLLDAWVRDEAIPLLFSREAVEAATVRRIELAPEGGAVP